MTFCGASALRRQVPFKAQLVAVAGPTPPCHQGHTTLRTLWRQGPPPRRPPSSKNAAPGCCGGAHPSPPPRAPHPPTVGPAKCKFKGAAAPANRCLRIMNFNQMNGQQLLSLLLPAQRSLAFSWPPPNKPIMKSGHPCIRPPCRACHQGSGRAATSSLAAPSSTKSSTSMTELMRLPALFGSRGPLPRLPGGGRAERGSCAQLRALPHPARLRRCRPPRGP